MKTWTSFDGHEEGSWKNVWVKKVEAQHVGGWRPLALPSMVSQLMPLSCPHVVSPLPFRKTFSLVWTIHQGNQRTSPHCLILAWASSSGCETVPKPYVNQLLWPTYITERKGQSATLHCKTWEQWCEQVEGKVDEVRDWSEKLLCKRQLLSQFNKRERRNKAVIVLKYRQWEKGGDQVKKTKLEKLMCWEAKENVDVKLY